MTPSYTISATLTLSFALLAATAVAQGVYRSVDKDGKVTYSDKPPASAVSVEEVDVQPASSDEEHREAKERAQRDKQQANQLREERLQQQAAQPAAPARPEEANPDERDGGVRAAPDPNPLFPYGWFPDGPNRPAQLPNRPAQLPAQLPNRPAQLPARPGGR